MKVTRDQPPKVKVTPNDLEFFIRMRDMGKMIPETAMLTGFPRRTITKALKKYDDDKSGTGK